MKKNVKILGAAAAALLAVAPVVASATTVNASTVQVNAGAHATTSQASPLNINATIDATANETTAEQAAKSVKLSLDNGGQIKGWSTASIQIVDAATDTAIPLTQKLQPGVQYRIKITGISFYNLLTGKDWDLGNASFNGNSTVTSSELMNGATNNTFESAPFFLTEAGNTTQPYFSDQTTNQLDAGAVANAGVKGEGLVFDNMAVNTANALSLAKNAAPVHNGGTVTTTATDVAKQLTSQGIKVASDGSFTVPAKGFTVTLTAINYNSGKTVTVIVPFKGTDANYSTYPIINFTATADNLPSGYSSNFVGANFNGDLKGKQSVKASQLVYTVKPGSTFNNDTALANFKATTGDSKSGIDLAVLSNPVNTNVLGRYTVTLSATDWTTGKTSRFSYTVQVGDADTTYQVVDYPAAYGVNVWNIAGNTVSFSNYRQPGQTRVATFDTKTIDGVEYTRINKADSNQWIQSKYLGVHHNETKPTQPAKPANNETKLNGVGSVNYNGKGSVRLLNAEGHYVDQYVKKGASFKVWAEKTVNGKHLYRIGSQSQWIPAQYLSLN